MGADVQLWHVGSDDRPISVQPARLDRESRLQEWIAKDISILDPSLLVIGREVETEFGGFIDILCMDAGGDLVIVELKRDKTPREVTAQALDYASWVADLSSERITSIAAAELRTSLDDGFAKKFGVELPDTLNSDHRILVVGTEIDAASERIIKYLSDPHGLNINAATFQYFQPPGADGLLARVFLIEPSEVELKTRQKGSSKRRPSLSYDDLSAQAAEVGIVDIYEHAVAALEPLLPKHTTRSSINFAALFDGSRRAIISLLPGESTTSNGLFYRVYKYRFAERAGLSRRGRVPYAFEPQPLGLRSRRLRARLAGLRGLHLEHRRDRPTCTRLEGVALPGDATGTSAGADHPDVSAEPEGQPLRTLVSSVWTRPFEPTTVRSNLPSALTRNTTRTVEQTAHDLLGMRIHRDDVMDPRAC
jgi:hypothetical protein